MKYCIECGKEIEDGAMFCTSCGTKQPELVFDKISDSKDEIVHGIPEAASDKKIEVHPMGKNTMIFSLIALSIYFIWGQGLTCAWWMLLIVITLLCLTFIRKAPTLQIIIGLFLIGVTMFGSKTLGYSWDQRNAYDWGYRDGYSYSEAWGMSPEEGFQMRINREYGKEVLEYKRFYIRGYKDGNSKSRK